MSGLPSWMQWSQGIALMLIPAIGAWIAFKQVRIATTKLNFDLYAKRFAVFEAARTYIGRFETEGKVTLKEAVTLRVACVEAVFLFDDPVSKYLDGLASLGVKHEALRKRLSLPSTDDAARSAIADELAEMETKITSEYGRLTEVFKPYLSLRTI